MRRIIIGIIGIAVILTAVYFQALKVAKKENARLSQNVEALNSKPVVFQTKEGKSAVKVEAVTYTTKELKKYAPKLVAAAKDAGIRVQDIQAVADVGFTAKIDTAVPTVKTDTSVCFNYEDKNFTIVGCYYPGSNTANIGAAYTDSLKIIPTRIPHKFLFLRWGCKAVELNVISSNKATVFNYAKYVELKK